MRRTFEELGPTYVKLGQLIASSHTLFPERYRVELRGCLDDVPPASLDHVLETIERELGAPATRIFDELSSTPLASASIAQVHTARLRSGEHVVVKVQRPGLEPRIGADLRILKALARFSERWDEVALAGPTDIVLDLEANLRDELDFVREASNMREFSTLMASCGEHEVIAPRVHADLSTRRLIVMERFFGHRIDDMAAIARRGIDAEATLVTGLRSWFRALIQHGFFHADVHAGNLMALEDGRIGFLDFGIVGRLSRERRAQVMDYLLAMASGDFARLAEVMRTMTGDSLDADLGALGGDLAEAFAPLVMGEQSTAKYADMIPHMMRIGVRHKIKLPRDFVLITKQMIYFDRYARLLAPNLNLFRDPRVLQPIATELMLAT